MKQENNYFWIGGKNTIIEVIKNNKREIKKILLNKNNSEILPKNNISLGGIHKSASLD